jgi:hypothetical protein
VRGRLTGIWATRRSGVRHVPVGRRDRSSPQEASHPHVADIHVTKDAAAGVRQTRILASRRVPDRRVSQPWDELVPPVLRRSVVDENVDTTSTAISRGGGNWTARPTAGPPAHQRNTRSPVSTGRAWHIVECPRTTPDVPRRGVIERRLDGARRSGVGRISVPVEVGTAGRLICVSGGGSNHRHQHGRQVHGLGKEWRVVGVQLDHRRRP